MREPRDFRDRVAVVTGASSGIGAGLARELARRGARVALVARRADRLAALAAEITAAGGAASAHVCDVGQREEVFAVHEDVRTRLGEVDLLVNAAGYATHALFANQSLDDIEQLVRTNYLGTVYWIKAVLPAMRERRGGLLLNVSSFAGVLPQPDEAAYSAAKSAVTGLSQSLAYELAPLGIHVLVVHPVLVRTEMFTPEVMMRLPPRSAKSFIEVDEFVRETFAALGRGATSAVVPRRFRSLPALRALSPVRLGGLFARAKLDALPDLDPDRKR